jgi:hypothetical protein
MFLSTETKKLKKILREVLDFDEWWEF